MGIYKNAIEQYENARKIRFPESPNYRLNARFAHAYLLMGDTQKAVYYVQRSEITLSLLSGIYSCEEDEKELPFISKDGGIPLKSELAREVAVAMCGGAFDYIYHDRFKSLSAVVLEGLLTKYHLSVAYLVDKRVALTGE